MTGTYIGTGSALSVDTPGFVPKAIQLLNITTAAVAYWTDKMADDSAVTVVLAAAVVTTGCITPNDTGFDIGTNAILNTNGEQMQWVAWG
jgi:hypothetical protein